ncbi:YHS domain-containing protein [Spirosoma lacussanchae]|uniref:YHS domain-containing (seleno)protein n=1 Tax=Spirosoma lacussanchae TaxID=1884249 RepID=UPI0014870856|nr:YHS domain-containing (seleno)protein [Spirosoma lacussanchae]
MKTLSILFIAFAFFMQPSQAGLGLVQSDPTVRKKHFNLDKGVAIQGYDPVAYFTQNKAVKGSAAHTFTHRNVTYRFASAANLKAFQENPGQYEPQYGGWCAYAMGAAGEKVEVDPETFKITDGKLFLFYHTFINNTLTKWNKDEPALHRKADASWSKLIQS